MHDILQMVCLNKLVLFNKNVCILIEVWLNFVHMGSVVDMSALV